MNNGRDQISGPQEHVSGACVCGAPLLNEFEAVAHLVLCQYVLREIQQWARRQTIALLAGMKVEPRCPVCEGKFLFRICLSCGHSWCRGEDLLLVLAKWLKAVPPNHSVGLGPDHHSNGDMRSH